MMFFKFRNKKDHNSEKRQVQRAGFYQSSYFLPVNRDDVTGTFECWFNNISEGGLAFETTDDVLKKGDEVKVLYKLGAQLRNDSLRIQFAYRVFDKYKCGCAFIDQDEKRKFMIDEYFKMHSDRVDRQ